MNRKNRMSQEDILAKKAAVILNNPHFTRRQILEWRSGLVKPMNNSEAVLAIGPFTICFKKVHDNRPESFTPPKKRLMESMNA